MKTRILIIVVAVIASLVSCMQKKTEPSKQAQSVQSVVQNADTMKLILARIYIKPGKESEFIESFREMEDNSNKEEGCLFYKLYQDPDDKSAFIVVERYKNQAAIDFHFGTDYFKAFGPKTADMAAKPTEILIYDISNEQKK